MNGIVTRITHDGNHPRNNNRQDPNGGMLDGKQDNRKYNFEILTAVKVHYFFKRMSVVIIRL